MVNGLTDSTVTLSWAASLQPNGAVSKYVVEYRIAGNSSFNTNSLTCLTLTIPGLASNTTYEFRVAAVNSAGRGPYTNFTSLRTGKIHKIQLFYCGCSNSHTDGPPANVDATVLSPRSVTVTWDPLSTLSFIICYIISYNSMESFATAGSMLVNRSSTSATVDRLEEFVSYNFTVQAVYDGGGLGPAIIPLRVITWSDG